ncbi:hypothetical protein [Burkholderia sp. ABCPW 14]|uniref:hypothetical protein n=1 Tax=Burkholderia sp. ABCPW 14 TaxID=1637860 RepID=UPI0012E3F27E|nr:hypothetical protein [Burkholderia sp. ABCPW 14]
MEAIVALKYRADDVGSSAFDHELSAERAALSSPATSTTSRTASLPATPFALAFNPEPPVRRSILLNRLADCFLLPGFGNFALQSARSDRQSKLTAS